MNQICLLTYEMSTLCPELSQDLNGNSQAAATRQKMAQLEQMLSALDQLRRVGVYALMLWVKSKIHENDFLQFVSSAVSETK